MEGYALYIIPVLIIQSTFGQDEPGIKFNVDDPVNYKTGEMISVICSLTDSTPNIDDAIIQFFDKSGAEITGSPPSYPHVMNMAAGRKMMALGAAEEDMAGIYKCKATVNEVEYEKKLEIEIRAALTFTNCLLEQYGTLGFESEIKCTASSSNYFTYWGRNPPLDDGSKYFKDETTVRIFNTEESDEGIYTYTAVAMTGSDSKSQAINFKVDVAPSIVEPILQTTAVVGKSATLYCNAKGKPDPVIEWRKAGSTNILQTTDRITVSEKKEGENIQGILNFTSVIKEDHAVYSCSAKNRATDDGKVQPAESSGELVVLIPPTFEKVSGGQGKEGGPASLECIARGDPIPDMVWVNVKNGKRYTDGTTIDGVSATKEDLNKDQGNLGAKMTLSFSKLKHSDAGEYQCEASNTAAEVDKIVTLEVQYKPNFNDQGETIFYNWIGNQDSYITCTANGNPLPGFNWYKGDREITAGDAFHQKQESITYPDFPHRATSKLLVSFNGNNGDAVFGDYKCVATNLRGTSEIALKMEQAERPGEPMVDVRKEDAKHIEFWMYEPTTKGPEVTHFKVVYKVQGGNDDGKEQTVEKEYRDHIDVTRKYTVMPVNDLLPSTTYVFTFHAINPVGEGPGRELIRTTKAISVPEEPQIESQGNSQYPRRILAQWRVPSDGGSEILEYKLSYQRVTVKTNQTYDGTKGYEVLNKLSTETTVDKIKDSSYTIDNLMPGDYYEIKVYARNGVGYSLPGKKVIRTREGRTGGLSTGAIIGIVIGVFFLLFIMVDVTCYFKNNCGILMSIKERVGGGKEEGYAIAKTDDVENLAKKEELTDEAKAVEEGGIVAADDGEKKKGLLSEEQKVDTLDEGEPVKSEPELEPEDKEVKVAEPAIEATTDQPKVETPEAENQVEDAPEAVDNQATDKLLE